MNEFIRKTSQLMKNATIKECFKNDLYCHKTIIDAHSLQKNKIINKIAVNGLVMSFGVKDSNEINDGVPNLNEMFRMIDIGQNKASTFPGFCKYHDQIIFRPIEYCDYKEGNLQQEFLFAYRAFAKSFITKLKTFNFMMELKRLLDTKNYSELKVKAFPNADFSDPTKISVINKVIDNNIKGNQCSFAHFNKEKDLINIHLDKQKYYKICSHCITFNEEFHIGVSSMFTISKDLKGKSINKLGDLNEKSIKPLFLTLFPQNGKTHAILSYNLKYKKYFNDFIEDIKVLNIEKSKIFLTYLIAQHIENFIISPEKWEKLPKQNKLQFEKEYLDIIPYKSEFNLNNIEMNIFI